MNIKELTIKTIKEYAPIIMRELGLNNKEVTIMYDITDKKGLKGICYSDITKMKTLINFKYIKFNHAKIHIFTNHVWLPLITPLAKRDIINTLAHELRHAYQYKNKCANKEYEGFSFSYEFDPLEIDANRYAYDFMKRQDLLIGGRK